MNPLLGCACSGLLLVAGFPARAPSPDSKTASIPPVTVMDVVTGKELADQTVVIQDGRIVSLAAAWSSSAPEGKTP